MDAVVTPTEMGVIDAEALEPVEVLIGRAGTAVPTADGLWWWRVRATTATTGGKLPVD